MNQRISLPACLALAALWIGCGNNPCENRQEAIAEARAVKGCPPVIKPFLSVDDFDPDHCPSDQLSEERISCEATVFTELTDCSSQDQVTQFQTDMALCQSADQKRLTARAGISNSDEE
jgi:hypothetical protein